MQEMKINTSAGDIPIDAFAVALLPWIRDVQIASIADKLRGKPQLAELPAY